MPWYSWIFIGTSALSVADRRVRVRPHAREIAGKCSTRPPLRASPRGRSACECDAARLRRPAQSAPASACRSRRRRFAQGARIRRCTSSRREAAPEQEARLRRSLCRVLPAGCRSGAHERRRRASSSDAASDAASSAASARRHAAPARCGCAERRSARARACTRDSAKRASERKRFASSQSSSASTSATTAAASTSASAGRVAQPVGCAAPGMAQRACAAQLEPALVALRAATAGRAT